MIQIKEFSLSRVVSHLKNLGFATISPYRYENTDKENNTLFVRMMHEINAAGYGFFKVTGRYKDSQTGVESVERSFLIPNESIPGKKAIPLKDLMIKLMHEYKQDSVLWIEDGQAYFLYNTGRIDKLGSWNTGKFNDYMTILKKKNDKTGSKEKAYFFDVNESFIEKPGNVNEVMMYKKLNIYTSIDSFQKVQEASPKIKIKKGDKLSLTVYRKPVYSDSITKGNTTKKVVIVKDFSSNNNAWIVQDQKSKNNFTLSVNLQNLSGYYPKPSRYEVEDIKVI